MVKSGSDSHRAKLQPGQNRLEFGERPGDPRLCRGEAAPNSCPLLDPYTPKVDHAKLFFAKRRSKQQRKVYSRIYWGLQLPGRYAFVTCTNCEKGELQHKNWLKIKKWLKRHYPGIDACRVFTDEGGGVIHLVVRQGMKQKRIDKKEFDAYLDEIGCGFSFIERVRDSGKAGLAAYLSDQRAKRGMSKEMANQTLMTKYNYVGEWLPPGWLGKFGRAWYRTNGMRLNERLLLFKSWLVRYADDPDTWAPHKPLTWDNEVGWVEMLPEEIEFEKGGYNHTKPGEIGQQNEDMNVVKADL